jgi:DNA-binding transcriptional MerR regulator/quercetin dioxygenase-like cupin family protein
MIDSKRKARRKPEKSPRVRPRSYPAGYLTVGQTARVLGVSPSTLRVWENVGLVTPARSNGRFRLYTAEMLELLKRIKYLRDVQKLSVPGIKQMLGQEEAEPETKEPAPAPANGAVDLGPRLRAMRKRSNMGIVEAAQHAGISPGFLSAVELSRANASVATLQRLASAYGTTVLEFFDLPERSSRLIRRQDRRVLRTKTNVIMEVLSIGTKMLECMLFRVPPGSGSDGAYSHQGEEFVYMLSGTIEFWLDETECHILRAGDSFWFNSSMGHRWLNASDKEAALLWVNTPVTF